MWAMITSAVASLGSGVCGSPPLQRALSLSRPVAQLTKDLKRPTGAIEIASVYAFLPLTFSPTPVWINYPCSSKLVTIGT